MRVLLSTYGSRGDVEPMVGLAVRLRALGAEVRVCAPPDEEFAELLAGVGLPLVPAGPSVRPLVRRCGRGRQDLPRRAAALVAAQFDAVAAAAEGADAIVATGVIPAAAAARAVAEKLGIRYVYATYCPVWLPSPHHRPLGLPGRPFPPEVTDNRALWDLEAQSMNALFGAPLNTHRASIGLPPMDDVREPRLHRPPVAGGGPDPGPVAGAGGPRGRADRRVDPAGRTPAPGRAGGVPGRRHTPGVRRLRQHPRARLEGRRPGRHRGDPRAGPPRHSSPAAGPTWP